MSCSKRYLEDHILELKDELLENGWPKETVDFWIDTFADKKRDGETT